jgi:hypothetical protein
LRYSQILPLVAPIWAHSAGYKKIIMNTGAAMSVAKLKRLRITDGEQSILFALFVVAVFGAGVAFVVVNQLGGSEHIIRPLTAYDIWSICSGAFGAAIGFYLGRDWFGFPGLRGVGQACLGIVVVSFIGSIVGGTIALPFYGTMFGPFSVAITMVGAPLLAVFWSCSLMSAHLLVAVWRRERDTIFLSLDRNVMASSARPISL